MFKSVLACCKIYISEGRNQAALKSIERAANLFPEAVIVNKFVDETYNRTGYTLVCNLAAGHSPCSSPLRGAVFSMVEAAFKYIDLDSHCGSHPRVGAVDHICFHPLASATLLQTAEMAKLLASDIGSILQVPSFLYGGAHEEGKTLDSIRRELGYFKPNSSRNQWAGGARMEHLRVQADHGPSQALLRKGVILIGATQWVDNYNVPVLSGDIVMVRDIARRVSERGGGLRGVQAMALSHGNGVTEVACNLLEPCSVGGGGVQLEVERLSMEAGFATGMGYFTDLSQAETIKKFFKV